MKKIPIPSTKTFTPSMNKGGQIAYIGKGDDASLLEWSNKTYESWKSFNELLSNDAIVYLASWSDNKTLRNHAERLGELLALKRTGKRDKNDHFVCPVCKQDWHLHFEGDKAVAYKGCNESRRS